ncbi:MAG TPA: protein kinase [Vicinamibacteria bacterium]|nr:protein kinase [Vicinamibacteria bacterium]
MAASSSSARIGAGSVVGGRYEILDELGAGGMATVFKAQDRALDVSVALKVLKASPTRDPELAQRFRSEIKLAWRVRHRNVCGIHEYGEDGDLLYISMELVEGKDLRRLLREGGPLAWEQAYDVAIQIAEGLEAIHEAGVIHRDLKPANITRDARGLVRLMDFGIAKVWGEDSGGGATRTGHVVGSPEYMSPEQVRGESLDFRSDLYALGLVIFELFTGRGPFPAETPAAAMMRRLERDPDWDSPLARQIPGPALPILRKALARASAARYASCGEILADLRAARAGLARQTTDEMETGDEPETATGPATPRPPTQVPIFSREAQARLLVPSLVKAVKHGEQGVRLGAVQALGRLVADALLVPPMSRLASEALASALREDADNGVRAAAGQALARLEPRSERLQPERPQPEPSRIPRKPTLSTPILIPALLATAVAGLAYVGWRWIRAPAPEAPIVSPPVTMATPVPPPSTTLPLPPSTTLPQPPSTTLRPPPSATLPPPPSTTQPPPPSTTQPPPPPSTTLPSSASTPPPPTTAPVAVPVVPATCISCEIPEAVQVLRFRLGLARSVRLRVHISNSGDVTRVEYLAGPAPLRGAITDAVLHWRYRPALRGEEPVPSLKELNLELP